ncbi:DsbC family protein [Oleiagrimonas sp. C23AA]|uniref:DsbC family protein n=1 Tax=Oleiagrimonas sp. C23AA TaxID=2719047 RepID=UPI00141DB2A7|nr:DsbC family protein [Oleiagrimonas sp. C23AA]NII12075.1 DsbC family protein [Oleiagrimonas sp. C23AA]
MKVSLKAWVLAAALLVAGTAQATDAVQTVRHTLEKISPGDTSSQIRKAPMPGFYQALLGGRMVYVSADGQYVMDGRLYDTHAMVDLTGRSMRAVRLKALAGLPAADRIIFSPPHPKYTVTVFTDVDCGYCRALHKEIGAINKLGIAVQYVAWPRQGIHKVPSGAETQAYREAVNVWCAKDRNAAFTAAMDGHKAPKSDCANPVADEFKLGMKIGVDGTPTIVAGDGTVLGGYMRPGQLLSALRQLDAASDDSAAADAGH